MLRPVGYSVELDTDSSGSYVDPDANHTDTATAHPCRPLDSGTLYAIDVELDRGAVDVYPDGVRNVSATIDDRGEGTALMFGFSAGTGALCDNHTVDDLSLTVPCQE